MKFETKFERSAGIILHPTSLPGEYGIGDLGPEAYRWIDFLKESACGLWQVLPLGPTGYGDSPYQSFSAFAGNPYLISPQLLLEEGLLEREDLEDRSAFPEDRVDYGPVINWKIELLNHAFDRFQQARQSRLHPAYAAFEVTEAEWLPDFALFMALKDAHDGAPWPKWEPALRDRDPEALQAARQEFALIIERQKFRQFIFFHQWQNLKEYAHQSGIQIVGDVPIFVAHDSADVWANPELFFLNESGQPTVVAGVPPDYFSTTGQLWGNPLYRWGVHARNDYAWWLARLKGVLKRVDIIRLDHFRGFAGYWEVPGGMPTAEKGRWVPGPGAKFLLKVQEELGELPLIAEDLGEITPDVIELRDRFHLPGMKILQFAFEGDKSFLPHNYPHNCVAYTGTHDNNTSRGWYDRASQADRHFARSYMAVDGNSIAWSMIRTIWTSVAMFSIAPMQDFLQLGEEARMNYPGHPSGNWSWRMSNQAMSSPLRARIRELNLLYERIPEAKLEIEQAREGQIEKNP